MTTQLYVGSYTPENHGSGKGITLVDVDQDTGALAARGVVAELPSPSYLALSPDGRVLYAVGEQFTGTVSSLAVGSAGDLTPPQTANTGGSLPCHLAVHPGGRHLAVAHYGDGVVSVHRLSPDGGLDESEPLVVMPPSGAPTRDGSRAHHICFPEGGDRMLVTDLGADAIHAYRFEPRGTVELLATALLPSGTGPRQLAVTGPASVVIAGELDSRVHSLRYDHTSGRLEHVRSAAATATQGGEPNYPAHLLVTGGGSLYLTNRGSDVLSVFRAKRDRVTLVAEVPCGGRWPRHAALAGREVLVSNQASDAVLRFAPDPTTGLPRPVGEPLAVNSPACVVARFSP